jgi:hypothetical protein
MLFVRQFFGFIAYAATIIALPLITISVAAQLTSEVQRHIVQSGAMKPPSRVDVGLQAQARAANWQAGSPTTSTVIPPTPELSAALLAQGMDDAEANEHSVTATTVARVAGWIKRAKPQPLLTSDSPGRIIERSLRADF